ncbi:receptor-type tyrosine-protein phosphatase N2-like isoform X2 [Ruditapes philippinarum]|uniref:receptor-type tyrosine-protein phosphatase N2-like isoform X2 n=1 Tax=Ruditapes philippinarum TaxID=129788 RepID=UPI00295ACA07|nr:receptor-type tyrosine-protein phosphatase N2-like isoform X2 [Ruditapes philippinarum]
MFLQIGLFFLFSGCLFSGKQELCEIGSTCIDDLLFGTCSRSGIPASFDYTLQKHDLKKLEVEILKLVKDGFSWGDGYTQCIIQNVIISLTIKEPFSKKICYSLLFDWKKPVQDEISSVLESLYEQTVPLDRFTSAEEYEPVSLLSPSQKRDEIVRVHKYFDKNEKIHKRNFFGGSQLGFSNYLSYDPRDDVSQLYPGSYEQTYETPYRGGWENSGIPYKDLQLVKDYLEATRGQQRPKYSSKLSELFSYTPELEQQTEQQVGGFPDYDLPERGYGISNEDVEPGYVWNDNDMIYDVTTPDNDEDQIDLDELSDTPTENTEEIESLPPSLANTLDKLIQGELTPENLTDDELEYLTPYVSKMLLRLSDADDQSSDTPEAWEDVPVEENMMQDGQLPYGIDEEEMMREYPEETDENLPIVDSLANIVQEQVDEPKMEKKSDTDKTEKAVKREDVVETNFAFIEMDQNLTSKAVDKMIDTLEHVVTANPGSLNNYQVNGTKLKINVDPVLAGLNATKFAEQARDHKGELEKATGYKFEASGIGNVTQVEVKGNDDRYFVLTFVLCGCIAGILLAVVVIYLIRRNSRSKEKLQQITAGQEGNEAASKDYQDLCRQRMQSKSSEKPEPLHTAAVSRVGSVSETQVRSPSSRSSTSSCQSYESKCKKLSEEPVNSNMDISTGHIVLSYMEDHLKNKDRLEREWEAMCAYEADPCSTKVAADNGNARKNRYADVLPYDHSRVVLTTNTNVSGADYINASTITDHDPRNPAYVATQGPLPHTVADFWQMVWEQGSVVIVMLTKLTENGEAKCHRYWPDEGSDLYHIYEVHLVSEHIWCEDYLVRSFYLKNLQTGETRTVTQFHFLTWPDLGVPGSIKALLDFRRKVNKSYRGRSCPIVVHCSDGCGRTGTYCLVDMVLNRMAKGAKEIDIAATLEHIRDQRISMVKTKEQFQFALAAVAEEVHAILKALPQ